VWDKDVSMGRLTGSNRQYIQEEIPHIGARLSTELEDVIAQAEVVVIGTDTIDNETLQAAIRPEQQVVDLRSSRHRCNFQGIPANAESSMNHTAAAVSQ